MHYKIQNWVSRPIINDFRHPTWTYHKVFEKMPEKCGKNEGKLFFHTLVFDSKTRSQFRPACMQKKNREKSIKTKSEAPPTLCMEMWTFPFRPCDLTEFIFWNIKGLRASGFTDKGIRKPEFMAKDLFKRSFNNCSCTLTFYIAMEVSCIL